jgi:hypothetical protein
MNEVEWVNLHLINIHEPSYLNCFISRGCAWPEALYSLTYIFSITVCIIVGIFVACEFLLIL